MQHQRMFLLTLMAVLNPYQLKLIRNMSSRLIREPREDLDTNSATDVDVNLDMKSANQAF